MNYKNGDLVKITGNCNGHWFKIGETVRLKEDRGGVRRVWKAEYLDGHDWWNVRESDMAPTKPAIMPQKIVITTDGKTTLARLFDGKTMVKRAEAKCAPSDVFDFGIGAELAVKRLMGAKPVTEPIKKSKPSKLYCVKSYEPGEWCTKGKVYEINADGAVTHDSGWVEDCFLQFMRDGGNIRGAGTEWSKYLVPLVRRPAKVGEWVYIDNARPAGDMAHIHNDVHNGDIHKVTFTDNSGRPTKINSNTWLWEDEYLVLDGYTGDPA